MLALVKRVSRDWSESRSSPPPKPTQADPSRPEAPIGARRGRSKEGSEPEEDGSVGPILLAIVDFLPCLKAGDSSCAAHAALRWVPASLATAHAHPKVCDRSYVASTGITSRQPSGRPARLGSRLAGDIKIAQALYRTASRFGLTQLRRAPPLPEVLVRTLSEPTRQTSVPKPRFSRIGEIFKLIRRFPASWHFRVGLALPSWHGCGTWMRDMDVREASWHAPGLAFSFMAESRS